MKTPNTTSILIALAVSVNLLAGCVGVNTFPVAARPGDTITLALGTQDGMNKSNTTVSFTDDLTETPVDLTAGMRTIMRLYPDPTSGVYGGQLGYLGQILTQNVNHDPWLTAMILDLPTSLPAGPGKIHVSTSAPQPAGPNPDINTHPIAIEILPGTGAPHSLDFMAYGGPSGGLPEALEPRGQFVFRPPPVNFLTPGHFGYGAVEFELQLPVTISGPDIDIINIVAQDLQHVTESKRQLLWKAQGDQLKVYFISTEGALDILETRFSILSDDTNVFPITTPPTLLSATYYDIDGNLSSGPAVSSFTITTELP